MCSKSKLSAIRKYSISEWKQLTASHIRPHSSNLNIFIACSLNSSYMAVTNLVKDQESDHTKRIALFAIEALKAAEKIPIDPGDMSFGNVQIRVGFHSGPVVADVVGTRSPRYCLFG